MKIKKIKFQNYRNLSGVELCFDLKCNFFVGENNIGKTNALDCIHTIYNLENFKKKDFFNLSEPIVLEVEFCTKLNYLNYKDKKIRAIFTQKYGEELRYESEDIQIEKLRESFNILQLKNGDFLSDIFPSVPQEKQADFIDFFNELDIIKRAKKFSGISGKINLFNQDEKDLLYSKFFIANIILKIINSLKDASSESFEGIIIYDQPEQNLHPFAQKTLVKDLINLASGKDEGFNRLIEQHFNVKSINIQLFFKSHSDRILLSDYSKIIRFYREGNSVNAVCGVNVEKLFGGDVGVKKQLDLQFPYFSLAIFARCVILIEGPSEFSAMEGFAKTLKIDLDYLGIIIISANGEGNVPALCDLLRGFKIKVLSIRDRDNTSRQNFGDNYFTDYVDFEDEIVNSCNAEQMLQIFTGAGIDYKKADYASGTLQKKNARYFVTNKKITKGATFKDYFTSESMRKLFCLALLNSNKSVLTGRSVGNVLSEEQIPSVYKTVLLKAKEFASK